MASTEDIRGHYVKVNATRIFYDEIGEGYPIVCVHTAGSCSLEYTYLLPLLAERGLSRLCAGSSGPLPLLPGELEAASHYP